MTEPSDTRPRLRPLDLARQAYALTFREVETVLRFCWLGAALLALAQGFLAGEPFEIDDDGGTVTIPPGTVLAMAVLAFCAAMLHAMVAVAWHRAILLGERLDDRRVYLRFGARESLYGVVAVLFFLFLFMGLGMAPLAMGGAGGDAAIQAVVFLGGPALAAIVLARSMLVLPAIALGRGPDLAMSWRATHGNGLRGAAALILVLGPVALAEVVTIHAVSAVIERDLGPVAEFAVRFVTMTVTVLTVSVVVAFMSLVYARLVGDGTGGAMAAGPGGRGR